MTDEPKAEAPRVEPPLSQRDIDNWRWCDARQDAAPTPAAKEPDWAQRAERIASERENYGFDNYVALIEDALRAAYCAARVEPPPRAAWQEIATALEKAEAKHPPMRGPHEGYAVILEELDELWAEVKRQDVDPVALRKEALHVAAMAVRFVKDVCAQPPDPEREESR